MKPDFITMSHGGGKQTGTLAEMIVCGEIERPHAVLFAETGSHPWYVGLQIDYYKRRLATVGVPLIVVQNGNIYDDLYAGKRFAGMPLFTRRRNGSQENKSSITKEGMYPMFDLEQYVQDIPDTVDGFGVSMQIEHTGRMKRQCTSEYKIVPLERELRTMLLEMNMAREISDGRIYINKGVLVETWIGYSMDEVERIKPSRHKWQRFRYPLIEKRMSKADCVEWLKVRGLPVPLSSQCDICPGIGDDRAIEMRDNDPRAHARRIQFDKDLRNGKLRIATSANGELYVHDSCKPLIEVELDINRPAPLIGCIGYCGT